MTRKGEAREDRATPPQIGRMQQTLGRDTARSFSPFRISQTHKQREMKTEERKITMQEQKKNKRKNKDKGTKDNPETNQSLDNRDSNRRTERKKKRYILLSIHPFIDPSSQAFCFLLIPPTCPSAIGETPDIEEKPKHAHPQNHFSQQPTVTTEGNQERCIPTKRTIGEEYLLVQFEPKE